ncbi:uncharacterized protein [Diadema antillarum]|uniref:uncharacterized protein n=1 Tax=Diadema antillarum TaxID=105358 RepID=UPI003A85A610
MVPVFTSNLSCGFQQLPKTLSYFFIMSILSKLLYHPGEFCEGFVDDHGNHHASFHCPPQGATGGDLDNIYCCGTSTDKFCCSQPTGYFLENFNIGAFVGGSLAIVIAIIICIIICCCCCSCCLCNRRQTRRRSMRGNGVGRSAVAYSTYPVCGGGPQARVVRGSRLFGRFVPLAHLPIIRHLHAPQARVATTPIVHEAPRSAPPKAVPNSYPKQQQQQPLHYSPHAGLTHNHQHQQHTTQQHPNATPPLQHQHQPYPPASSVAPPTTIGAAAYPPPQPSPHMCYQPQHAYVPAPVVHTQQVPPGAAASATAMERPPPYAPSPEHRQNMHAPPLLDKGGYHLQGGDAAGPSAPPAPPPATNPYFH